MDWEEWDDSVNRKVEIKARQDAKHSKTKCLQTIQWYLYYIVSALLKHNVQTERLEKQTMVVIKNGPRKNTGPFIATHYLY